MHNKSNKNSTNNDCSEIKHENNNSYEPWCDDFIITVRVIVTKMQAMATMIVAVVINNNENVN